MPPKPMTDPYDCVRWITTKRYGFEKWQGVTERDTREELKLLARSLRAIGVRCRLAVIPDTGYFGYPERYFLIMPCEVVYDTETEQQIDNLIG